MTEDPDFFNDDDFVFTEKTNEKGEKEYYGGSYKIDSFFLKAGMSPITTMNTDDDDDDDDDDDEDDDNQSGGKVSKTFENIAIPAGLYFVNMPMPKERSSEKIDSFLSDDLVNKFYSFIYEDIKPQQEKNIYVKQEEKEKAEVEPEPEQKVIKKKNKRFSKKKKSIDGPRKKLTHKRKK
jgi:hypothetical protein